MSAAATVIALVVAVLALGLVAFERGPGGGKELALVAALVAAATAGRLLFAPVPQVKPVTMIVVATGAALGARAGFAVGAITPLVSNAFLGQGWWTPGQMTLWGLAGASGALLAPLARRPAGLAALTFCWGFLFGWGMDLWQLAVLGPEVTWRAFLALSARSVWFEAAHAAGNVAFSLIAGPALLRLLDRYAQRARTEIVWSPH